MATVNIPSSNTDASYRYKMPRLIGKVEGRGNGIKTAIPNMVDVAASLHRPPGEVTKFFGCELGAQTTYVGETERAIVNGAHETRVLQDKLSIYIEKFVLCPACKLPETAYKIKHETVSPTLQPTPSSVVFSPVPSPPKRSTVTPAPA